MKNMKKVLAAVLAGSMLTAGALSASAIDLTTIGSTGDYTGSMVTVAPTGSTGETVVTGTAKVKPATLSATLPAELPVLLNPGKIDGADQVLSPIFKVTNKSDVPVDVFVTKAYVLADAAATYKISQSPIGESDKRQSIQLFLHPGDTNTQNFNAATATTAGDIAIKQLQADPTTNTVQKLANGLTKDGTGATAEQKFLYAGAMNAQPDVPWSDVTLNVKVAFTIKPSV